MAISFVQPDSFGLGYHYSSPFETPGEEHLGYPDLRSVVNLTNAIGYIPVVGLIATLIRVKTLWKPHPWLGLSLNTDEYASFRKVIAIRACVEAFGLGLVFLLPDLIFTFGREYQIRHQHFYARPIP